MQVWEQILSYTADAMQKGIEEYGKHIGEEVDGEGSRFTWDKYLIRQPAPQWLQKVQPGWREKRVMERLISSSSHRPVRS